MRRAFRISSLFIGTVIGAGFATGREVALFFGDYSPLAAAFAGIVLGGFAFLFLAAGKKGIAIESKLFSALVFLCALITFGAMLAASEDILYAMTRIRLMGLITGIFGIAIVVMGIEKIKFLNAAAVPLIILFILILFVKSRSASVSGGFCFFRATAYGAMNIFLSGILMLNEGGNSSKKEIIAASVFTGVFLAAMLFMIQCVIRGNSSSMPMLAAAQRLGLTLVSQLLVFLAVFTTLVSSAELMTVEICKFRDKSRFLSSPRIAPALSGKIVPAVFALTVSYPLTLLGFDRIVDWFYPMISVCGVLNIILLIFAAVKRKKLNVRKK